MSVNLSKGSSVNLAKASTDAGVTTPLTKVKAGAGWDMKAGKDVDLDLLTVKLGTDGKAIADVNGDGTNIDEAVTGYMHLTQHGGSGTQPKGTDHSGDNTTGEGDGDDETVTITLADVEAEVAEIAVVVAAFSDLTFADVENVKLRILNADGDVELATVANSDLGTGRAVEVARIKRDGDSWTVVNASTLLTVADGKSGNEIIKAVLDSYGVTGL